MTNKREELNSYPGEGEYELARAMWMVEQGATGKSFDRLTIQRKNVKIARAIKLIEAMKEYNFVVMHESNIDGG
jgi:hypothetical protein